MAILLGYFLLWVCWCDSIVTQSLAFICSQWRVNNCVIIFFMLCTSYWTKAFISYYTNKIDKTSCVILEMYVAITSAHKTGNSFIILCVCVCVCVCVFNNVRFVRWDICGCCYRTVWCSSKKALHVHNDNIEKSYLAVT